ncbi:hypothetical protein WJX84_012293 [Apatococcus fuscideae]|uniref:Uncharacterized protein n=1 Tax=Apatococcus fuscideae TaxID=2026836 RepID=A0AAW1T0R6_9CHLO
MLGLKPAMPLARRVASHFSFLGRSAPETGRLREPAARSTLASISSDPDLEQPLDTGVFELELSRHGSRNGSQSASRHPSFNGSQTPGSIRRSGQQDRVVHGAVPTFLTRKVLDWSWPQGLAETQLLQDVIQERPLSRGLDGFEVPLLADGLAARGWKVQLCCQGHSCAQSNKTRSVEACLDNLHHQYIHCHNSPDGEAMDTIIEPRFKEMFQIGPATPLFTSLLESVPEQFVGHPSKLALLAEMLSAESVKAFKEQGWTLPPWRKVASMLAKWGLKVPSHEVKDHSVRPFHGNSGLGQVSLPPLPFEPARLIQEQQLPKAALEMTADSRQAGDAPAQGPERISTEQPGQQAPHSSFARLLLSGGLWGLEPDKSQQLPPGPSKSPPGMHNLPSSPPKHEAGAPAEPDTGLGAGMSKPEETSAAGAQLSGQRQRISLLAQGLAKAPRHARQEQPLHFNPSWAHLLPPVTTVQRSGAPQPETGAGVRR